MQNLQWYPGHMAKTRRMIEDNLKLIDVVVEILDARIPFSGRNPNFDDIIRNKPRLIVLNKADLADKSRTKIWINKYAEQGLKVIPISCATGLGINTVLNEARAVVQDKIDREKEKGRNRTLKLMMVGIPNVGKSSLINRLVGKASTKTGDRPGVTRGKQWLRIKGDAELLDTPGILPPKFDNQEVAMRLAYTGAIRDEIMNTELLAYSLCKYLRNNYSEALCTRYKLDSVDGLEGYEILEKIGKKRGFVISGGEIDMERAANMLLDELRGAKIGMITLETPDDIDKEI
ncbi:MAG: ribosome biogenesis GTPase YlqF [Clostridia bacterium]|nr:ribosome biogenesis GTPase YlqF [Clostridia bacterium]MCI9086220.1 ribosome biogenesis GTPase YlqF [Clostridia bacterium]